MCQRLSRFLRRVLKFGDENIDEEGFRDYCARRKIKKETIQEHITLIREFEEFLKNKGKNNDLNEASPNDVKNFVAYLMENRKITLDSFRSLIRYCDFSGKKETVSVLYGYLEGFGVPEELRGKLKETMGEQRSKEIFEGINIPPLGTIPEDKPKITKKIMERLDAHLDDKSLQELMSSGLEVGPDEWYLPQRKKFQESKSLDDFLEKRHIEFVETLEKHSKEKTMFFAQEIDEEVIEHVRKNQEIQGGVRKGDIIYETKIPYQTKKYLHEKDEKMRRYYACHCSWVREAIKSGIPKISPDFCYCSAGYHKRPFEIIFSQPVKADVIETVLKGDPVCRFAIHIPKQFLQPKGTNKKR
jgi:hypothetical protein